MKVAVTGLYVPDANAGILTVAFVTLTAVKDSSPVPELIESTVTEFAPFVTAKADRPPGNKSPSVTVTVGLQFGGVGLGVGIGVGVGVGVGVGIAVETIFSTVPADRLQT